MTVVNMLVNNAFKHYITLYNKTILYITIATSYFFNSSINLEYNNIEFKKLFIDLKVSTRLTGGIC